MTLFIYNIIMIVKNQKNAGNFEDSKTNFGFNELSFNIQALPYQSSI